MKRAQEEHSGTKLPKLAAPTAKRAISLVNARLRRKLGKAVNVSKAHFNSATYCWHLPIQISSPEAGPEGIIGDVFLHAATGRFIGFPTAEELQSRAIDRTEKLGLNEKTE